MRADITPGGIFPDFELRKSSPRLVDDGLPEIEAWATPDDLAF